MADQEKPSCFKGVMGTDSRVCDDLKCENSDCALYWIAARRRASFADPSINGGAMDGGRPRY